jgi:hypothetical protein
MNTGPIDYQQSEDEQKSAASSAIGVNSNNPNLAGNTNVLTPAESHERVLTLTIIAFIAFLTGRKF